MNRYFNSPPLLLSVDSRRCLKLLWICFQHFSASPFFSNIMKKNSYVLDTSDVDSRKKKLCGNWICKSNLRIEFTSFNWFDATFSNCSTCVDIHSIWSLILWIPIEVHRQQFRRGLTIQYFIIIFIELIDSILSMSMLLYTTSNNGHKSIYSTQLETILLCEWQNRKRGN